VRDWCVPNLSPSWSLDTVLVDGTNVGVRLDDGRVFVGRVTREPGFSQLLMLRLWGCHQAMRISRTSVVSACVVGQHTWSERQAVVQRQRAGHAAFVVTTDD
jgi:hypothetical protein